MIHSRAFAVLFLLGSTSTALAQTTNIQVASCVGQINLIASPTSQGSFVFSIVDQASKNGASVTVTDNMNPATILSAGGGNMALTVPSSWREPLIAMAVNGGYQIVANLSYHMNGAAYVIEDFRMTRSLSGHTECP